MQTYTWPFQKRILSSEVPWHYEPAKSALQRYLLPCPQVQVPILCSVWPLWAVAACHVHRKQTIPKQSKSFSSGWASYISFLGGVRWTLVPAGEEEWENVPWVKGERAKGSLNCFWVHLNIEFGYKYKIVCCLYKCIFLLLLHNHALHLRWYIYLLHIHNFRVKNASSLVFHGVCFLVSLFFF